MRCLRTMLSQFKKDQKGNIIILVALSMVMLMGFAALAIDGGSLYQTRRQMVNAADAAALAGAQELIRQRYEDNFSSSEVVGKAVEYGLRNGSDSGRVEVTPDYFNENNDTITVITNKTVEYSFARVLGFSNSEVSATATAFVAPPNPVTGLRPIGVSRSLVEDAEGNPELVFHQSQGPGSWGFVYFPGDTQQFETVAERMWNGYDGNISLGDDINIIRGAGAGNINFSEPAIQHLIGEETEIILPIIDDWYFEPGTPGGGHREVEVVGFIVVRLLPVYNFQGDNTMLRGEIVGEPTFTGSSPDPGVPETNLYTITLID